MNLPRVFNILLKLLHFLFHVGLHAFIGLHVAKCHGNLHGLSSFSLHVSWESSDEQTTRISEPTSAKRSFSVHWKKGSSSSPDISRPSSGRCECSSPEGCELIFHRCKVFSDLLWR